MQEKSVEDRKKFAIQNCTRDSGKMQQENKQE
jgi:hypothetical protein